MWDVRASAPDVGQEGRALQPYLQQVFGINISLHKQNGVYNAENILE